MSKNLSEWPLPEIPDWMSRLPDDASITTAELAQVFKRPSNNFMKGFKRRYEIHIQKRRICFLSEDNRRTRASTYKMKDVRALVDDINNER